MIVAKYIEDNVVAQSSSILGVWKRITMLILFGVEINQNS